MPTEAHNLPHLLSLPAGRELDRAVHAHVMGGVVRCHVAYADCSHERRKEWTTESGEDVPHYSTDIADAWLVVEHFSGYASVTKYCLGYAAVIAAGGGMASECETAPLAICYAALRAKLGGGA